MGDRYELDLTCSYCQKLNKGVYYAPTCEEYTFSCKGCGKENFITSDFSTKRIEDVVLDDVKKGFKMATSFEWEESRLIEVCKNILKALKERQASN